MHINFPKTALPNFHPKLCDVICQLYDIIQKLHYQTFIQKCMMSLSVIWCHLETTPQTFTQSRMTSHSNRMMSSKTSTIILSPKLYDVTCQSYNVIYNIAIILH